MLKLDPVLKQGCSIDLPFSQIPVRAALAEPIVLVGLLLYRVTGLKPNA